MERCNKKKIEKGKHSKEGTFVYWFLFVYTTAAAAAKKKEKTKADIEKNYSFHFFMLLHRERRNVCIYICMYIQTEAREICFMLWERNKVKNERKKKYNRYHFSPLYQHIEALSDISLLETIWVCVALITLSHWNLRNASSFLFEDEMGGRKKKDSRKLQRFVI